MCRNRSTSGRARIGFTLIELLVVIAIISLLVSILLPSLNRAKELAKQVVCASNLKSIGLALGMYTSEWGVFPIGNHGVELVDGELKLVGVIPLATLSGPAPAHPIYTGTSLRAYIDVLNVFICPSHTDEDKGWWGVLTGMTSYAYNGAYLGNYKGGGRGSYPPDLDPSNCYAVN